LFHAVGFGTLVESGEEKRMLTRKTFTRERKKHREGKERDWEGLKSVFKGDIAPNAR